MKRILSVLTLALVAVLPAQAQFGSDDLSTGISPAQWTLYQSVDGTMTVSGANGHASFLVPSSSTSEQSAHLVWNGRPTANTDWTLEVSGHDATSRRRPMARRRARPRRHPRRVPDPAGQGIGVKCQNLPSSIRR